MDYSSDTPFKTFSQIQKALEDGTARLSFQRSAAYNIACSVNPLYSISNLLITIISMLLVFLACHFLGVSKWFLLFGIVSFIFNTVVPHLKVLLSATACALLVLHFTVLHSMAWLVAISAGIFGMIIGYDVWWGLISAVATNALRWNEELFQNAWEGHAVALKVNGKLFFHSISL